MNIFWKSIIIFMLDYIIGKYVDQSWGGYFQCIMVHSEIVINPSFSLGMK